MPGAIVEIRDAEEGGLSKHRASGFQFKFKRFAATYVAARGNEGKSEG